MKVKEKALKRVFLGLVLILLFTIYTVEVTSIIEESKRIGLIQDVHSGHHVLACLFSITLLMATIPPLLEVELKKINKRK